MTSGMDEGSMLTRTVIEIDPDETSDTLFQKFCNVSGSALIAALRKYLKQEIILAEQEHHLATYTKKLSKEDGQIQWSNMSAQEIRQLWQACTSWPGIWTILDGKRCKILGCHVFQVEGIGAPPIPGTFWKHGEQLLVATHDGVLELDEIIIEGKSKQKASKILLQ